MFEKELPVPHDTDGSTELFPVPPSESIVYSFSAVTPSPVMQPQYGKRSISDFPELQTAETKITSVSFPTI